MLAVAAEADELEEKGEWRLSAAVGAGYAMPGPPASTLSTVLAPSQMRLVTLSPRGCKRRAPACSSGSLVDVLSSGRCCRVGSGVLAQWVPLHAVSCSNLIELAEWFERPTRFGFR